MRSVSFTDASYGRAQPASVDATDVAEQKAKVASVALTSATYGIVFVPYLSLDATFAIAELSDSNAKSHTFWPSRLVPM